MFAFLLWGLKSKWISLELFSKPPFYTCAAPKGLTENTRRDGEQNANKKGTINQTGDKDWKRLKKTKLFFSGRTGRANAKCPNSDLNHR